MRCEAGIGRWDLAGRLLPCQAIGFTVVHFAERAILDNAQPRHTGSEDLGGFASTPNWTRDEHIRTETRLRPAFA